MQATRRDRDEVLFELAKCGTPHAASLSVAVSLYDYERFIVECLESVKAQTHPHVELIVVDDRSQRDESVARAQSWLQANAGVFDRALLIRHRDNRGLAAARNTAFEAARTEFVFVLDADNQIYPKALATLHAAAKRASASVCYSQLEIHGMAAGIGQADLWSRARMRFGNYVDAMALISKRAWADVAGYSHIESGWEDFDFWCKLIEIGEPALFVPEILCRYRHHGNSMLRTDTDLEMEAVKMELTLRHPWLRLG